jgi:hypothetical protein
VEAVLAVHPQQARLALLVHQLTLADVLAQVLPVEVLPLLLAWVQGSLLLVLLALAARVPLPLQRSLWPTHHQERLLVLVTLAGEAEELSTLAGPQQLYNLWTP